MAETEKDMAPIILKANPDTLAAALIKEPGIADIFQKAWSTGEPATATWCDTCKQFTQANKGLCSQCGKEYKKSTVS